MAEILIVMLISSMIVLGINVSFQQAHRLWSGAESPRPQYHAARLLVETLRNELTGLYFPPVDEENQDNKGFTLESTQKDQLSLSFYSVTPCWKSSFLASHPARVTYVFTKENNADTGILYRREQFCAGNHAIGKETSDTIISGISQCDFFVVDPNSSTGTNPSWQSSFTAQDKPPSAVKIRMKWPDERSKDAAIFETAFTIPCEGTTPQSNQG